MRDSFQVPSAITSCSTTWTRPEDSILLWLTRSVPGAGR
jgi:hypothetical protein